MRMKFNIMLARVYDILFSDLTALRWSEGWMAFFFGVTLLLTSLLNTGTEASLPLIFPLEIWGAVFTLYGVVKLFLVIDRRNFERCRVCCGGFGLCLWSYLFATSALLSAFSVTDILFLMPLIAQAWFLAEIVGEKYNAVRNPISK